MEPLAGPFAIAAALLAAAGAAKVIDPSMTAGALRRAGLRVPDAAVRVAALAELAIGAAALAVPSSALAAAISISYLAFAAFVVWALRTDRPVGTCGCFGKADTPPSAVHVAMNLGLALFAGVVAVAGGVDVLGVIAEQPLAGVPFVLWVALGTWLVFVSLTALPRSLAAARAVRRAQP